MTAPSASLRRSILVRRCALQCCYVLKGDDHCGIIACLGVLSRAYSCMATPMRVRGSERRDDLECDGKLAIQPTESDIFILLAT